MSETFRSEYVRCGRAGCRKCPHGPYWYGYRREAGRVRKRYIGKVDPRKGEEPHPHDAIFNRATATYALAREILALGSCRSPSDIDRAFREAMLRCHPDRGGDVREAARVNAAYTYLRR